MKAETPKSGMSDADNNGNGCQNSDNRITPPGSCSARAFKQFWNLAFVGSFAPIDLVKDIFVKTPAIDFDKLSKCSHKTAVMTGGPRGIGFDIVKKLLQLDFTVILGVRNIEASESGIGKIRKLGISSGKVKLFQLDLKSLVSVNRFAQDVLSSQEGKRIDLLLNNAGIMNVPFELTEDGFESQFQVNYLSHFLLTNLLLPRIKETATKNKNEQCFIVNTSSHAQRGGNIDFDELETSKVYSPLKCYFNSKLCQVIHAKTLESQFQQEGFSNIHAYSVHPGEIPTDLWLHLGPLDRMFRPMLKHICRTTDGAANTVLYPVFSGDVDVTVSGGQYFESGSVKVPNRQAESQDIQRRLWEKSLALTRTGR